MQRTAYAAGVWGTNLLGQRYLENLILVKRENKEYGYVIRYTPIAGWFDSHSITTNMDQYQGKIEIFNTEGTKIGNIEPDNVGLNRRSDTFYCEIFLR